VGPRPTESRRCAERRWLDLRTRAEYSVNLNGRRSPRITYRALPYTRDSHTALLTKTGLPNLFFPGGGPTYAGRLGRKNMKPADHPRGPVSVVSRMGGRCGGGIAWAKNGPIADRKFFVEHKPFAGRSRRLLKTKLTAPFECPHAPDINLPCGFSWPQADRRIYRCLGRYTDDPTILSLRFLPRYKGLHTQPARPLRQANTHSTALHSAPRSRRRWMNGPILGPSHIPGYGRRHAQMKSWPRGSVKNSTTCRPAALWPS